MPYIRPMAKQVNQASPGPARVCYDLFDRLPVIIFELDGTGNLAYANAYAWKFMGYEASKVREHKLFDFVSAEYRKEIAQDIRRVLKGGVIESKEYEAIRKDGRPVRLVVNAVPITENGKSGGVRCAAVDLTERSRIEDELWIKKSAIETSVTGILFLDIRRTVTDVNRTFLSMWGYRHKEEVLGRAIEEFFMLDHKIAGDINEALGTKMRWTGELAARRKDGTSFDVLMSASLVLDRRGRPVRMMGSCADITYRKKMEKALEDSRRELEEKNVLLEEKNTALQELIGQVRTDRRNRERNITTNINRLLMPLVNRLRDQAPAFERKHLDLLTENIRQMTSGFGAEISSRTHRLSQREMEICGMIRNGLSTKEIADLLRITFKTAELHRNNIRRKLGIVRSKVGLQAYLNSL